MTNARPLCSMDRAVSTITNKMKSSTPGINLARQWLFPEVKHYTDAPAAVLRNGDIREEEWADPGLNVEQRVRLVLYSLIHRFSKIPSIASCFHRCFTSVTDSSSHQWPAGHRKNKVFLFLEAIIKHSFILSERLLSRFSRYLGYNLKLVFFFAHLLIRLQIL